IDASARRSSGERVAKSDTDFSTVVEIAVAAVIVSPRKSSSYVQRGGVSRLRKNPQYALAGLLYARPGRGKERHAAGGIAKQPRRSINTQLVARVGNIQVPQGQLADAVGGGEGARALLHRQPLGPVGQVRALRI